MKAPRTIVWDVDDVLNDLMQAWLESAPPGRPFPVCYDALSENPPHRLLGISREEYLKSLDAFRLSKAYQGLQPVPEVVHWFRAHGSRFHHMALTAVPLRAAAASAQWVISRFGSWIRSWSFVPSRRAGEKIPQYDLTKAALMKRLGAVDLYIDDSGDNIASAQKTGVKTLLFPRPWNGAKMSIPEALDTIESILGGEA